MKKVLVLNGSPRKTSDTMVMTNAFLNGLDGAEFEVEIINVIDRQIGPCRGCLACWKQANGHCVFNDDQNGILDGIIAADIIIWSFPLYAYSMPSHIKAVLDRMIPLNTRKMEKVNGAVRHVNIADFSAKQFIVICGCGFPNFEGNFNALRMMMSRCFPHPITICMPEAPMMNAPEAAPVTGPKKLCFENAGREFSQTGSLRAETLQALEAPMIPQEVYLAIVNGEA